MSNFPEEFQEAAAALDLFPIGHAQFVQERLRAGLIDGARYIEGFGAGCKTCFYGSLALRGGLQDSELAYTEYVHYALAVKDQIGVHAPLSPFEKWLPGNHFPEERDGKEEELKVFDEFLTQYIAERQLREVEVTCELAPIEVLELA